MKFLFTITIDPIKVLSTVYNFYIIAVKIYENFTITQKNTKDIKYCDDIFFIFFE